MVATNELRASEKLKAMDPIWDSLREEARVAAEVEPLLAAFLYSTVLNHRSLEESVIHRVCERLDHPDGPGQAGERVVLRPQGEGQPEEDLGVGRALERVELLA